ncbi:hypothetical protein F4808DRAFT_419004 [Astrocystis sublimbata]|nr:hypothetical protein F4808DRAFT_419004 [Astrocystis sublimbata]
MIAFTVSLVLHCLQATRTPLLFSLLRLACPAFRRRQISPFALECDKGTHAMNEDGHIHALWYSSVELMMHG